MKKRASHLLDEPPILCYPHLAKMIGINQALILQQLHFLLAGVQTDDRQFNFVDGRWWVYNSYANWQRKYFIWLSADRIKRILLEMEKDGYIVSQQGVKNSFDREKWYSIDYLKWELFKADYDLKHPDASDETAQSIGLKQPDGEGYNNPLYMGLKQPDDLYKSQKTTEKTLAQTSRAKKPAPPKTDTIPAEQMNPMKDAIHDAFGYPAWNRMTGSEIGIVQKTARELCKAGYAPDAVKTIYAYCKAHYDTFSPGALASNASKATAQQENAKPFDPLAGMIIYQGLTPEEVYGDR